MSEFPLNWTNAKVGDLISIRNGFAFKSSDFLEEGKLPAIRQTNLSTPIVNFKHPKYLPEEYLETYSHFQIKKGDLLIGLSGSIGNLALYNEDTPALQNQRTGLLIPRLDGALQYVKYYLNRIQTDLEESAKGVAVQNISSKTIEEWSIPLPPLSEQIRIANKLDGLLAKVDAAQTRLEKIPILLKRFRQSVLAAATSGELTREWRGELKNSLRPEIVDFNKLWEIEYSRFGKKFNTPKIIASGEDLPDLPETWLPTRLGHITDVFVGATPSRKENSYWNGNINWVSSSEVAFCRIKTTKEAITEAGLKNTSTNIHPIGTVMLAMIGQGRTRGQAAILDIEACHNQNTAALRVLPSYLLSEYLYFFLWSQYEATRKVGGGNNQQALNKSTVQGIAFPYPPIEEQKEIIRRVESLFALADSVDKHYIEAKKRTDRLTQSILAKAFRGELVPQDPNDEPASELLKRIQAERKQTPTSKPKDKKKKLDLRSAITAKDTARIYPAKGTGLKIDTIREKYSPVIADTLNNLKGSQFSIEQFKSMSGFSGDYDTLKAIILNLLSGIADENEPLLTIDSWDDRTGEYRLRVKDVK